MSQAPVAEHAEEIYFYLFHVSQKAQRIISVKTIMNLCFLIFLAEKLKNDDTLTWAGVFMPLFAVNFLVLCTEVDEAVFLWNASDAPLRLLKPLASLSDITSSIYAKGLICYWLTSRKIPYGGITVLLLPSWLLIIASTVMRCWIARRRLPPELTNRHRTASYISAAIYFLVRGLQPSLITLKIDDLILGSWFATFSPSFALTFMSIGASILLLSAIPWVHLNANRQLREIARHLTKFIALSLLLVSVCCVCFLVNLCPLLQERNRLKEPYHLFIPLLLIYSTFVVGGTVFFNLYRDYQSQLTARVLQRLDRPDIQRLNVSSDDRKWSRVKAQRCCHWLIESSPCLYTIAQPEGIPRLAACQAVLPQPPSLPSSTILNNNTSSARVRDNRVYVEDGRDSSDGANGREDIEMTLLGASSSSSSSQSSEGEDSIPLNMAIERNDNRISTVHDVQSCEVNSDACIVCLTRPIHVVLQGCGHAVTCLTCAITIATQSGISNPHCPLCRHSFDRLLDLPLGNRAELPIASTDKVVTVVRSDWQYSFVPQEVSSPYMTMLAAEMNNVQAIGSTVNTLAAINTSSAHYSLIDILI